MFDGGFDLLVQGLPWQTVFYNGRPMDAVRGGTSWKDVERFGDGGIALSSRDYIFRAEDFCGRMPEAKDVITDEDEQWTAYPLGTKEVWRYCGPGKSLVRVHCKQ